MNKLLNPNQSMNQKHEARNIVERIRVEVPLKPSSSSSSSIPRKQNNHVHDCCSTKFMIQNHSNFKRSGAPSRFMFYQDGSWVDFSGEVFLTLRSGFLEGKPMIDGQVEGSKYLFDFLRMLQVDFLTGNQKSIAWIDVNGKYFFPKIFVGEEFEFATIPENSAKRKRELLESKEETEESSSNNQPDVLKRRRVANTRWSNARLAKEGERAYSLVKSLFLSGLRTVDPDAIITSIHQCTRSGPLERARWEVFRNYMETTKSARGVCNSTFAWHGTSAEGVASILTHGFGVPSKITGSEAYGIGVYLSPARLPHLSAMLSEVDDNGEKHVVLCRVILGNVEKVEAGSQQFIPSSVNFDTGVDDLKNPKRYVVWCANMNTHILPECVVSYKSSDRVSGQLSGSALMKWIPNASNSLVVKLFSKLGSSLPSSKVRELETLCSTYKAGKVAKDIFIKHLRSITGNEMLLSTIREIRGS